MKTTAIAIGALLLYFTLHTIVYSEPAMLIVLTALVWLQAETDEWGMRPAVWSMFPILILATVETLL